MIEKYKKSYIKHLKREEKRAILFINGYNENDFEKLEELSLRKIMFTNKSLKTNYRNNHVMHSLIWEEQLPANLADPNWENRSVLINQSVANCMETYMEGMYGLATTEEAYKKYSKILCPEKRREDLDKYFHVEATNDNSRVMVYEASPKHLYTMIIYAHPFWFDGTHVEIRIASDKSLYRDDNIRLGADMYGMEEWLRNNIEMNSVEDQKMLKAYKYTTVLYLAFPATGKHRLWSGDVNKNLVIE